MVEIVTNEGIAFAATVDTVPEFAFVLVGVAFELSDVSVLAIVVGADVFSIAFERPVISSPAMFTP